MLVWGGNAEGGARYNPRTDTWSAISSTNAPEAAWHSSAVWTGTELIVFGGGQNAGPTDAGGRYNPSTNQWTALPAGPAKRAYHTAVWTGQQMILAGGTASGGTQVGDAFTYDPASNAWAKWNSSSFVREAQRDSHCAVWTGSAMILWGGHDSTQTVSNTGEVYDPQNKGNITALSTAGSVPSPRASVPCVWTGTQLITWGGFGLANGGRTRTSTAGWDALATSPLGARDSHSMVWTGTDVIIWGGIKPDGINPYTDGARYNPATNTWTAIASYSAGRGGHTAVWTGQEMIIWGGFDASGNNVQTGARYVP
jgi:N-acetylneuraminic acid mutarotase